MDRNVIVDAGFLVALLNRRDSHHGWAAAHAARLVPPWQTCEAVLSEAFHLLGAPGGSALGQLLRRGATVVAFELTSNLKPVLSLLQKYSDVPMSFADACLVRMSEILAEPIVLTTDADFRIYRRYSRQTVPCRLPS